jgi:hypothetical protein
MMMHAGGRIFCLCHFVAISFACSYHDVVWEPTPNNTLLLLLLPSDHVCLVLLVYWILFFMSANNLLLHSEFCHFEIREIGVVVVCSWQQSLTQSGETNAQIRKQHKRTGWVSRYY